MIHAVIMAGGAGTRFWPASRSHRPKQLLALAGERTMIQSTVERLGNLVCSERTLVVTNQRLVEPIAQQLPQLPSEAIVGEPCKRDTAACIGLAALLVSRNDADATMLVLPADHVIGPDAVFQQALSRAAMMVDEHPQRIVTFGIPPTYPAEAFGYIQRGELLDDTSPPAFRVERFREKPSIDVAREYLASGDFYWNAGIFIWKAQTILAALAQYEPEIHAHLEAIAASFGRDDYQEVLAREFAAIKGKSIDFAVMERYHDVAVVEAPFDWDDVGNWTSLPRLQGSDGDGNTIVGKHLGIDTRETIVRGEGDHLIVTVGLEDCIVVHTPDATLVANRNNEESIRRVVEMLKEEGWDEYL